MSITAPLQPSQRDLALAALMQAHREIGQRGEQPAQIDETVFRSEREIDAARVPAEEQTRSPRPGRGASLVRPALWSLMGLLASVGIGVAAFAWQRASDQAALDPISTASVSTARRELQPQPAPSGAAARTETVLSQTSPQSQTTAELASPVAPTTPAIAPDLAQSMQKMARELADAQQSIDQLRTGQAQMARDNAELAERLKAAQELARRTSDLTEDLKVARAQMARDNADFTERLKANQEQMARLAEQLKASQEQVARLVASEQKPRPRTVASSPPIAGSIRRPAPTLTSPQARAQPQDPRRLLPKPKPQ